MQVPLKTILLHGIFAMLLLAGGAAAQDTVPLEFSDDTELEQTPVYSSPKSVLSGFFGKRRAGVLVNGMEDMVGVTATGLSPLAVLSVTGPVVYFMTEVDDREELIFFYQPWFWSILIVITTLVLLKDTLLTWAGWLKTPLNILAAMFHFAGFLLGFRYLYHILTSSGASGDESHWMYGTLVIGVMFLFYISVWILGNCVEVLIIISPFPFVDLILKAFRIFLILCMYVLCWIHPLLALLIAIPIILVSLFTFERSLRIFWLGIRLSIDLALMRKQEVDAADQRITAFSIAGGNGLPWFTLGHLTRSEGEWWFVVRRFIIGPKRRYEIELTQAAIARGNLFPSLADTSEETPTVIVRLMPCYRGQEEQLAQVFESNEVIDLSISRSLAAAWAWLRGLWQRRKRSSSPDTNSLAT
ncbi:MAG: hypothetical protein COA78_20200 [Blastopirellula sp.]|nr:MAG: hypothetical protein COA78_20200 [Blastopirellula sp.]